MFSCKTLTVRLITKAILFCFVILCLCPSYSSSLYSSEIFSYRTIISGDVPNSIKQEVIDRTETFRLQDRDIVTNERVLIKIMNQDKAIIEKILRSHAYYSNKIEVNIRQTEEGLIGEFHINKGPQFVFDNISIELENGDLELKSNLLQIISKNGMEKGLPCESSTVFKVEEEIVRGLKDLGYPLGKISDRQYVVDYTKNAMDVWFRVDPGPKAYFGSLVINGLKKTRYEYIKRLLDWAENEPFSQSRLDQVQRLLYQSGLFSAVSVRNQEVLDEGNRMDLIVDVTERKHRSISGGIGYKSYEGPGISFAWENLNLLGGAERLSIRCGILSNAYYQKLDYLKPYFRDKPQDMLLGVQNKKEEQDAYEATIRSIEGLINIPNWKKLAIGYGILTKYGQVSQMEHQERYTLFALQLKASKLKVDDILNPSSGYRGFLSLYPSYLIDENRQYLKLNTGGSAYLPLSFDKRNVVAARVNLGIMGNITRDAIPADERFYSGGDQSVRGYPYQSLGELRGDRPLGGKALLELSMEYRRRVRENLGLVAFLDGGTVYRSLPMDGSSTLRYGSGIGLRFMTPIGPIRLDLATPLNRRKGIDRYLAVYFSVGQAF